jgi:predicted nicotinamide N-methyase
MTYSHLYRSPFLPSQLGAGTAVPGLVAAKCGAHITLSDREDTPRLLDNLRKSCDLNGLTVNDQKEGPTSSNMKDAVRIMALSWGVFSPDFINLEPQDVILASDCFYDTKGVSTILYISNISLV